MNKNIKIKQSTKDSVTQVTAQLHGNLAVLITCELVSFHISDYYKFKRYILIPSKINRSKWDQLSGESYCSKVPKATAIANMNKWIREMANIIQKKDS